MNWARFNTHGDSPERAFEALSGCLFERWCQEEYGDQLEQVAFVNGAGGDGGVEAYATLRDGGIVGLQAKWFREPLDANRLDQVRKSFSKTLLVRRDAFEVALQDTGLAPCGRSGSIVSRPFHCSKKDGHGLDSTGAPSRSLSMARSGPSS